MSDTEQVKDATEPGHEAEVADEALTPQERHHAGLHTIKNHAITAMGIGILPVPGLDLVALTGVQLNLLRKLGGLYGFTLTDELGKKLLSAVLGGYLPLAVAGPASSLLKFVPGIGIAAGVFAQSTLAGATTYAVGKLFFEHFEKGGTLLDVKPADMAKKLKKTVEEGKSFLKQKGVNAS
ncbi:GTPase associated protein [Burkholderia sp. SRS-46]|nr:GTPase associated protein [Burkholderia sp. SRS-46]